MKKLLLLTMCALLVVSAIVSAQNTKQDSQEAAKKSSAEQDPFGADEPDPFGDGANPDPFEHTVADPDKATERDPFDAGPDPFSSDGRAAAKQERESSKPAAGKSPVPSGNYFVVPIRGSAEARRRIETILAQEAEFDYLDMPLAEVIEDIGYSYHLPIVFDRRALDDFGIDTSTPIALNLSGISLRSGLRLMLHNLDLTFMIRDEVLVITSTDEAKAHSLVALFPLSADLVADHEGDWLVEVITGVIAPETWTNSGGSASVVYVPHLRILAVRQSGEVLAEIGKLLTSLEEVANAQGRNPLSHAQVPVVGGGTQRGRSTR